MIGNRVRTIYIQVINLVQFIRLAIQEQLPLRLWPEARRRIRDDHTQYVNQVLVDMVRRGELKMTVINGETVYHKTERFPDPCLCGDCVRERENSMAAS